MANKTIRSIIRKFFGNDMPEAIQATFRRWWLQSDHRQEKDFVMEEIWEETPSVATENTVQELKQIQKRIKETDKDSDTNKRTLPYIFSRAAAILLLPLLGAAITYLILQSDTSVRQPEMAECFVPNGERKQIELSDGTKVWLNSGSLLIYAKQFTGDKRSLYLNGEASFDVAKNPHKPFIVKTAHMEVEALGTLFNVSAYPDQETTIATLQNGKIRVLTDLEEEKACILSPDEQLIYNHRLATTSFSHVDAARVLQWKNGYLTFQGASFDQIAKALERRFDVIINYETGRFAGRCFTLKFNPDENLDQILEVIKELIKGLNYKRKENIVYIN